MTINLISTIENDSAIHAGGFSGAVFLTYTLNLGFFEQIVAPALERAGCSNVLIISDPDGYAEAIESGQKNVSFAGVRYVCEPLLRKGNGVQHIKLLLMAGPNRGRLLIGSGNLTMHGYSRNLEVYSHYEYDRKESDPETQLAFHSAWKLISEIAGDESFSSTANRQLKIIAENADWLTEQPLTLDNFEIWENFDNSIWAQFINWREKTGLIGSPIKSLRIFSPYYDQKCEMLRQFIEVLCPSKLNIYLSQENTTLNGQNLQQHWPDGFSFPKLFDIKETRDKQNHRLLHAKVIVGIEERGSWCLAGSANMTRAAFAHSWHHGSNLEMINFRWSPDPTAFDFLLDNPVSIRPIELNNLRSSEITDFSEQPRKVFSDSIMLTELTLQNKYLIGKVSNWPTVQIFDTELIFLRSGERLKIEFDQDLCFRVPYNGEIRSSEAAFIKGGDFKSLPRWIDLPDALQEYGSRSYHERIQAKLDTVIGAEALFHELMEFLFERVIPDHSTDSEYKISKHRTTLDARSGENEVQPAPDSERFVVPERDATGTFRLGNYTRLPYDRNIHSLRDLLSIVLLKLTLPPSFSTETLLEEDGESSKNDGNSEQETEENQIKAQQRLCNYLIDYCKRYARRICQRDFVDKVSPTILLNNHLTLARVLLEFETHISEFKTEDFTLCYWLIWSPLIWPEIIGIEGKCCWLSYSEKKLSADFIQAWDRLNISSLFKIMTCSAFGQPPSWSLGLYSLNLVSKFLTLRELIARIEGIIPLNYWKETELINIGLGKFLRDDYAIIYRKISTYLPPARERLAPIFDWIANVNNGKLPSSGILEKIKQDDLQNEFDLYQNKPIQIYEVSSDPDYDGEVYCPRCGGSLRLNAISNLKRGRLVLCTASSDVWLIKKENLPKRII